MAPVQFMYPSHYRDIWGFEILLTLKQVTGLMEQVVQGVSEVLERFCEAISQANLGTVETA
jgi:hypothetical protein